MITKYIFRAGFIMLLLGCSFAASLFMVLESAEFYRSFYADGQTIDFGLWAAVLNEVFLVIMAAVWLPKVKSDGGRRYFHPGNLVIKLLMLFLFINTVGGASLNVVSQNLDQLQQEQNRIEALESLKKQVEDSRNSIEAFVNQNQRLNTAIQAKNLTEINKELRELQLSKKSTLNLWLDVFLLLVLRFTIQLANITSVWLASWLFRQPISAAGIFHADSGKNLRNDLKASLDFSAIPPAPQVQATADSPVQPVAEHPPAIQADRPAETEPPPTDQPLTASTSSNPAPTAFTGSPETNQLTPPITPPELLPHSQSQKNETAFPHTATESATVSPPPEVAPQKAHPDQQPAKGTAENRPVRVTKPHSPRQETIAKPIAQPPDNEALAAATDSSEPEKALWAKEMIDMWATLHGRVSVTEFCRATGIAHTLFQQILKNDWQELDASALKDAHRKIKSAFENAG